jgi:hypothetical protein
LPQDRLTSRAARIRGNPESLIRHHIDKLPGVACSQT